MTVEALSWPDYVVITVMMVLSIAIGIYYSLIGNKQKTIEEYFSASRSMRIIPIGIALMVSFMSAITLLGVSAENYSHGSQFLVINLSYVLGTPLVCYAYLPVFYKLQATSVYEYLEKRFGVVTRVIASIILWVQVLIYSGVVLYAPALAFQTTTKLPQLTSILSVGLACTFYSTIGGIRAVLITDILQAALMFASLIIVIVSAAYSVGGLDQIWKIAEEGKRVEFDNFSIDPTERHTWWSLTFGGLCTFLSLYGINQVQIQRLLTVKDLKSAQKAMWISWPILAALSFLTCFSGLAIYSKYYDCDPVASGKIKAADMVMPFYVMESLSSIPGLPGLFVAGIFSAGLSTISAVLNSLSAITLEDYIKPLYKLIIKKEISGKNSVTLCKILTFLLGLACIGVAILAQYINGLLETSLTIFGIVGGPLLGLFTLGMLSQSATQKGAVTGIICALLFLIWIAFGKPRPEPSNLPTSVAGCTYDLVNTTITTPKPIIEYFYLYKISYMWYAPLGCLITFIVGWILSKLLLFIKWEKSSEVHPDLFFPCISKRIIKQRRLCHKNKEYILSRDVDYKDKDIENTVI